jgi:hypothetical protein
LLDAWLPLTYALNAINRSTGAADIYPFVLTAEVQRKLGFVDRCVRAGGPRDGSARRQSVRPVVRAGGP